VCVLETGEDRIPPLLQYGMIGSKSFPEKRYLFSCWDTSGEVAGDILSELIEVMEARGVWLLNVGRIGEVEYTRRE